MTVTIPLLSAKDLTTDQSVRWCPGCGDYSVLSQLQHTIANLGQPRERIVFVSGFGCAGRLPFYLNTFGFHTLPGRALALAAGLKSARPELTVWAAVGDGDALGPSCGQLMHVIRRNVDIKILLFNNEVLGLTRGQVSPVSRAGTRTRTSPMGVTEAAFKPLSLALSAGVTFAARTADVDAERFNDVIRRATFHRGTALVEVYQNCAVFNDGAFEYATDPGSKADVTIELEHGKPILFGSERNRALRLSGPTPEVVDLADDVPLDDVVIHDEALADPTQAWLLSRLSFPEFPECFGVFRDVDQPTLEDALRPAAPARSLQELLAGDDPWIVD